MKFISTKGTSGAVTFLEAMKNGLAPDGGLYMPVDIPSLPPSFWGLLSNKSFDEIAFQMAKPFLSDELSDSELREVVQDAFNFPLRLTELTPEQFVLELFHGPTLAFKDFGARFMARLFSEQARQQDREVTILVATSGDTGSAVAHGFHNVQGVNVILLYPKARVSRLQEQQMATLGGNITVLEVDGVFDDCQRMVKQAFLDRDLTVKMQLSSANSINIARLLPQSFYYAFAAAELQRKGLSDPVFSVPSGNFGNLTGGLLAMKMGLPVKHFIAATNVNDVVPRFLAGEPFEPKPSIQTISNAMDVGDPSNFARIESLFGQSNEAIREAIDGFSCNDDQTLESIKKLYHHYNYLACPHTAIGLRAAIRDSDLSKNSSPYVTLATAHPVKFRDSIEPALNIEIEVPQRLRECLDKPKRSVSISSSFDEFREFLLES